AEEAGHGQAPAALVVEQQPLRRIGAEGGVATQEPGAQQCGRQRHVAACGGQRRRQQAEGEAARDVDQTGAQRKRTAVALADKAAHAVATGRSHAAAHEDGEQQRCAHVLCPVLYLTMCTGESVAVPCGIIGSSSGTKRRMASLVSTISTIIARSSERSTRRVVCKWRCRPYPSMPRQTVAARNP